MLQYIVLGGGFAFAACVQPGPLQAFLLSRVAAVGWRRTLPASLAPLLSDGPIALVALLVLGRLPPAAQSALRAAGGLLLLYLAWAAVRGLRVPLSAAAEDGARAPRTLLQAALVNVLNPNPYLGWSLVLGPAVVGAWRQTPANAVALIVAFYGTMVAALAGFIAAAGTARLLRPRGQRALVLASALVLAALGLYQLVVGFKMLAATP